MDFEDEDSPFDDLPRYPTSPEDEPVAWMDTAAENFANAGPTLIAYGLLAAAVGTLVYGLMLAFGLCGWFCSLGVVLMATVVVVFGHTTWRR